MYSTILYYSIMFIIYIIGGWHVLKDFDVHAWDVTRTIVQLHSKYSVSPFFKIDVVPDDKVSGQNIIQVLLLYHYSSRVGYRIKCGMISKFQISPAGLGLPDRRYYYRQQDNKVSLRAQ